MELPKSRNIGTPIGVEKVKNETAWVNKKYQDYFNLLRKKSSDMALFLRPRSTFSIFPGRLNLLLREFHGRSADIPEEIIGHALKQKMFELEGEVLRDFDLKGEGYLNKETGKIESVGYDKNDPERVFGLLDRKYALLDSGLAELFSLNGIRCHKSIAVIDIKEVFVKNFLKGWSKISVEKLKQRGIIPKDFRPVIQLRGFGTKTRLDDLINTKNNEEFINNEIEDAISLVEFENKKEFDIPKYTNYMLWLAEINGRNLAKMHKLGYVHGYATTMNFTLDGRITDFDSVQKIWNMTGKESHEKIELDWTMAKESLEFFYRQMNYRVRSLQDEATASTNQIGDSFAKGYQSGLV